MLRISGVSPKDFINAYNLGKRLKAIKGFTPVEFVAKKRGKESTEFAQELYNKNLGLDR
ncbi:hypothetical protein AGMMS50296_6570 [Alphaproteobacteria bacterium]|nr:hypothetical protein AGMMS50296_6570 [Alphaproteobacteria bacterium]